MAAHVQSDFVMRVLIVLIALARIANAGEPRVAVASNFPLGWLGAVSIGASTYLGVMKRHAIRLNVARSDTWEMMPLVIFTGNVPETWQRVTVDLGAGWVFYPSERFRGVSLELGALRRARQFTRRNYMDDTWVTDTATYSVRGLVGYSWLIGGHFLIAAAVGGSGGYERGTQTDTMRSSDFQQPAVVTTERISRLGGEVEAYLRFGFAI